MQFGTLPVFAGEGAAAFWRAAFAFHGIIIVIRDAPIVRQFFAGADVADGDECDFTTNPKVRIAGVVAVEHRSFALFLRHWRNKQIVANLNFDWAESRRDLAAQKIAGHDMSTFDGHDFILRNISRGKKTVTMNGALAHFCFRREI